MIFRFFLVLLDVFIFLCNLCYVRFLYAIFYSFFDLKIFCFYIKFPHVCSVFKLEHRVVTSFLTIFLVFFVFFSIFFVILQKKLKKNTKKIVKKDVTERCEAGAAARRIFQVSTIHPVFILLMGTFKSFSRYSPRTLFKVTLMTHFGC